MTSFLSQARCRSTWVAPDDWHIAFLVCALLAAVYSLTYSGIFITDDEHILASRALALAFDGDMNDARVYGNDRVRALANLPGEQAAQATSIEPGQVVVGAALARLAWLLGVGRVQAMFTLNVWATALAGAVVFFCVRSLGYASRTAIICALALGLGTQAWPHARTYFRDVLAMLFLALAWLGALRWARGRAFGSRNWLAALLVIAALAAGILTKNTVTLAIPALAALALATGSSSGASSPLGGRLRWRWSLPLLALIFAWVLLFPRDGPLARFSPGYYWFLARFFFTTPHPNLPSALAGPFVSPGKSIFLYSPVLLLPLAALFFRGRSVWPAWVYLVLLVAGQALFYDDRWWGHVNWGLRFVLPALPPLAIAAAPAIDAWLRMAWGRLALLGVFLIAFLVQLIGVLPPARQYYVELIQIDPARFAALAVWQGAHSVLLWHAKWLLTGGGWDLAAVRVGLAALGVVVPLGIILGLASAGLAGFARKRLAFVSLVGVAGLSVFMLYAYSRDPAYYSDRADLHAAQAQIEKDAAPGDVVVLKSYGAPVWYYWMNWAAPQPRWTALPFFLPTAEALASAQAGGDAGQALDSASLALFTRLRGQHPRVWTVLPNDSPGGELGLERAWLDQRAIRRGSWTFAAESHVTRLLLYDLE